MATSPEIIGASVSPVMCGTSPISSHAAPMKRNGIGFASTYNKNSLCIAVH